MNRRQFLQRSGMLATAGISGFSILPAQAQQSPQGERRLHLYNIHTGEETNAVFCIEGQFLNEGLQSLDLILRDHRANQAMAMQRMLYEKMYYLQQLFSSKEPLYIVSGYRSPKSNADLRHSSTAVAEHSLHTQGRAVDIRIPGVSHRDLHKAALAMRSGGVGYYPKDGFVHLDTGRVRHWQA